MAQRSVHIVPTSLLLFYRTVDHVLCTRVFPGRLGRGRMTYIFRKLQSNAGRFKGAWVMQAGMIIEVRNVQERYVITVLQKPIDNDGSPLNSDASEGHFLV